MINVMTEAREKRIRERAYSIWQAEGCPEDRQQEHWHRAMLELGSEGDRDGGAMRGEEHSGAIRPREAEYQSARR
jgi:hypothetical protein